MRILTPGTIEICDLCGEPLNADNSYGTDDMPLCRYHHGKVMDLVNYMITGQLPLPNMVAVNQKEGCLILLSKESVSDAV